MKENKCIIIDENKIIKGFIHDWKFEIVKPFIMTLNKSEMKEIDYVRLIVLFKLLNNLRLMYKVDKIYLYVKSMSNEMCYYFYNKIFVYNEINYLRKEILK